MPAKKKPVLPAIELGAERYETRDRARRKLDELTIGTLSYMTLQQLETVAVLKEILAQLKKTNKIFNAILSLSETKEEGGVH